MNAVTGKGDSDASTKTWDLSCKGRDALFTLKVQLRII